MPLIRPGKPESRVHQELQQQPQFEVQLLQEMQGLRTDVQGCRGQVRDLRTVLMGEGETGETPHGRLPMVEREVLALDMRLKALEASRVSPTKIEGLDTRLKYLEDAQVRYGVYGRFVTAGSGAASGAFGALLYWFVHHVIR